MNATIQNYRVDRGIDTGAGKCRKDATLWESADNTKDWSKRIAIIIWFVGLAKAKRKARAMGRQYCHPAQSFENMFVGCCPKLAKPKKTNMAIATGWAPSKGPPARWPSNGSMAKRPSPGPNPDRAPQDLAQVSRQLGQKFQHEEINRAWHVCANSLNEAKAASKGVWSGVTSAMSAIIATLWGLGWPHHEANDNDGIC